MPNIRSAIKDTVPISLFNRGFAGKIFKEVKETGAKVVMKNNAAECVLLSPEEYLSLLDEVNDAKLAAIAAQRLSAYEPAAALSEAEMNARLGIPKDALTDAEKVEFE